MLQKLSVLIVNDLESDALLFVEELRRSGYDASFSRVASAEAMIAALGAQKWDIVLSAFRLSGFSAAEALAILRERDAHLPFIVVSSHMSEEDMSLLLQAGARDCLAREYLQRLGWIVKRELAGAVWHPRHSVELAIAEGEEKLHQALAGARDARILFDADGRVLLWNAAASLMFGHPEAEAVGALVWDLINFQDPDKEIDFKALCSELLLSGSSELFNRTIELVAVGREGLLSPVEVSLSAVKSKPEILVVIRAVTGQNYSKEQLRRSAEVFNTLARVSRVGIFMSTLKGEVLYFNDRWSEISGRSVADGQGLGWQTALHPDDRETVISEYLTAVNAGLPYSGEHRFLHKDGSVRWVLAQAMGARDEQGKIVSYIGTVTDISELRLQHDLLRRLNRALISGSRCNKIVMKAESEEKLLQDICQVMTELGGYAIVWIGFAGLDDENSIRPLAHAGFDPVSLAALWSDAERKHGPAANVLLTKRIQVVKDINATLEPGPCNEFSLKCGCNALISLPIRDGAAEVIGALTIYDLDTNAFSEQEITLLEDIAFDLSFGIASLRLRSERDRAQGEMTRAQSSLRESLETALQAIAATTELRDPYTAGHQQRVAELARAVALEMGLARELAHSIHLAGVVHDVGKIHIPAEILSKPTKLTMLEYELIKTHSQAGYEILKGVNFPWPIAKMVLQHHERLDGSGYPQGLKGDEILLEAKILAVCDVVEAMSSHRPYRPSLGIDAALQEVIRGRGSQYDPQAVDACVRLFREKQFVFPTPSVLELPVTKTKSSSS